MSTTALRGSMTALVTPFADGRIDARALRRLVDQQIEHGTHALVPCGSTGEAATLSHEEHTEVVRLTIAAACGRVPVIAGTGSNATAEAIRLTRDAKEAGADAALLISPYYNKPTQEGIFRHYEAVAQAVDLPLIAYNIPGRTGSKIEVATLKRLAGVRNVIGVKDATGSLEQVLDTVRECGPDFAVYSGEDALTLPIMAVGGAGVITAVANVAPREMADLASACLAGRWDEARVLQLRLLPLIHACFIETNPIPVKTALAMMGVCAEEFRLPLTPMPEATRARLRDVLREYRLIG
jgi:4-hydroxy-tetrahydrodipicolinate synthase